MTEYESINLALYLREFLFQSFTLFLTTVFAYLAAAFVAGARLTTAQVCIVNTLFVLVCAIFTRMMYLDFARIITILEPIQLLGARPEGQEAKTAAYLGITCMVSVTAAALYFMWSVRNPKAE